tara:strand:+ start:36705 stop:36896 length:192 start_codon:yes stop_codon:yes gene_type:complete
MPGLSGQLIVSMYFFTSPVSSAHEYLIESVACSMVPSLNYHKENRFHTARRGNNDRLFHRAMP